MRLVGRDFLGLRAKRGAGSGWTVQHLYSQLVNVADDVGWGEVSVSLVISEILENFLGTHVEARAEHLL